MLSRIGTFANANALLGASLKVQARMADQQAQEASSLKSTSFGGLGGDAGKLLNLSGQSGRLTADNAAATSATAVVQAAYSAVSNVADLATTIRSQLAAAISGADAAGSAAALAENAANWLDSLQSELNTEVGGVYVFAGQASDTAPVDFADPDYAPAATPGTPNTQYYQGAASPRTLTTASGMTITLSATADAPGFETLARALSAIVADPGDAATLQAAYDQVGDAVGDLTATQATISNQASSLDTLVTDNKDKITALDNLATVLDGADLASATVLVTQYQSQLDALYSSISKLASDSLLKYL